MWLWDHDIEFTKWQHPQCGTWLWDDNVSLSSPGGNTLDTDIAILSIHLCAHPSIIFPLIVFKRLKISSYFLQHMIAQSLPVYFVQYKTTLRKLDRYPYGVFEYRITDGVNKFHDYYAYYK